MRAGVLVMSAALVLAAPATAGTLISSQRIAARTWHNPCDGRVTLRYGSPPAPYVGLTRWWITANGRRYDCRVVVRRGLGRGLTCTVVLHEYGHLAGRKHSINPNSVMYAPLTRVDHRCLRVLKAR